MQRIIEPEIMDDEEQVRAYAAADFEQPHTQFITLLGEKLPSLRATGNALDLGCGSGDITGRFASAYPGWSVDAIDGSEVMLNVARQAAIDAEVDEQLNFIKVLLPASPPVDCQYDLIFSNSVLHHFSNPTLFWSSLLERSAKQSAVFVMDLIRPSSQQAAATIVQRYSADEPDILRHDFYNSLLAAFEPEEIAEQLELASLGQLQLEVVSDRHMIVWGLISR